MLRRRLQYALDEIAHLKQADGRGPEYDDELGELRGQVETQQQVLDRMSVELAAAIEERRDLTSRLRALAAAGDQAKATAEQTGRKVRALRQMIAELQRRLDAKARELAGRNAERRQLATEIKRRRVALDALQRQLDRHSQEAAAELGAGSAFPRGDAEQPGGIGFGLAVPTLALSPQEAIAAGTRPDAAPATAAPSSREADDEQPIAPIGTPLSKAFGQPRPARLITPLLWTLPALLVLTVVINRWYAPPLGSDAPAPGANATAEAAPPPMAAPGVPLDQMDAKPGNSARNAEIPQKAPPSQDVRDRLSSGGLGPKMVAVGPATFTMGSDAIRLHPDESPPREVKVGRFLIGAREVTYADYERFARTTGARMPDDFGWGRGQHPVAGVSWEDAQAYTQWLSRQTGHRYRLPSEAEWEYAARGDSEKSFWWGAELEVGRAVCFDCGTPWDDLMAAPVASLAPNPFGLYDTAGNVMEWAGDCWNPNYTGAPSDARTRADGNCGFRVARGGAFNKPGVSMRSAARYHFVPETRIDMLGFRVVRED